MNDKIFKQAHNYILGKLIQVRSCTQCSKLVLIVIQELLKPLVNLDTIACTLTQRKRTTYMILQIIKTYYQNIRTIPHLCAK